MIQRIQSVYLLLVIIACVAYIFVPVGQVKTPENVIEIWLIKNDIPIPSIYNISKTPFRYHNKIKAAKRLPFIIRNFL